MAGGFLDSPRLSDYPRGLHLPAGGVMNIAVKIGILAGLAALFNMAAVDGPAPNAPVSANAAAVTAGVKSEPATIAEPPAPAAWGVEYEDDMRRDIAGLTDFINDELAAIVAGQKDTAPVLAVARGHRDTLAGCGGVAGMADYALALNDTLAQAHVLFTALEVLAEREENMPTGADSEARLAELRAVTAEFETRYRHAARWLWDINDAFAAAHPEISERIDELRETGKLEGGLHQQAEADSYASGYPLADTAPLRARAQIFAPYAKGALKPGLVCP